MLLKNIIFAVMVLVAGSINVFAAEDAKDAEKNAMDSMKEINSELKDARIEEHKLRAAFKSAIEAGDKAKAKEYKAQWRALHDKNMAEFKTKKEQWVKDNPEAAQKVKERRAQWMKDHPNAASKIKTKSEADKK